MALPLSHAQKHAAPDHQLGQLFNTGILRLPGGHQLAAPHDRDAVGYGHDLAQLVGDEDDGFSLLLELRQNAEQMIGLRRRQNAGGFIEDEHFSAPEQSFQDFDALLQTHRQGTDDRIGVDLKLVIVRQSLQFGAGLVECWTDQGAAFGAEHDVLQHRERLDQHEMLVHHADAAGDGVGG